MERRHFLSTAAAALAARGVPAWATRGGKLPISAVEISRVEGERNGKPVSALYLTLKTSHGPDGLYGPIDKEAAIVVDQQLRSFLLGRDALAMEDLWYNMFRSNRHSRHGLFMMAISAVDNALWDLRGRYFDVPVYRLLGGPTRPSVEAYASCLGYSTEPGELARKAAALKEEGYRYEKWFLVHGPEDGADGMRRNVEIVRTLREAVGDEVQLMFDAYSRWDLTYALEWAHKVERYRPHWIEEAFHPEKLDSFTALRSAISFPVASGEHLYGRWEVEKYLRAGALNIVQADPEWCGGISELVKITTAASLHDARVIPHGHSLHAALHVVASQPAMTCPLVEYLLIKLPGYYHFERTPLVPADGRIALPEGPGFGIELDPAKVLKRSAVTWS